MRPERHPAGIEFPQFRQRHDLIAAGVGEDRPAPSHEAVQASVRGDRFEAGPQPQMESVAEDDLRAVLDELRRAHRLHRAVGAHRHEHRRFDISVREFKRAEARSAVFVTNYEFHACLR